MAVKKEGEKYTCGICGNEVVVTKVGGGSLVCCGKNMKLIDEQAYGVARQINGESAKENRNAG